MEKIRMGVIGLGNRGRALTNCVILPARDVDITAVCDVYDDRVDATAAEIKDKKGKEPFRTCSAGELLARTDVDAVLISCAWEDHIPLAIEALKAGKAVALEVGGAYSTEDCFKLVRTYEETRTPFMFMENCCFDRYELLATAMARHGLFGRVVHCEGAYSHDLREEVGYGDINRHYRLRNYINRNLENYPTHDLGPIAKLLGINRGNRMTGLVCGSTGSFGLHEYVCEKPELRYLKEVKFAQGDIFHTIITCENGETVLLRLDTTLPRFYTRNFTVRGTKGLYEMNTNSVFFDYMDGEKYWEPIDTYREIIDNAREYEEKYLPEMWKKVTPEQLKAGHGGMDWFEFDAFFTALREGSEMPVDVYDAAAWMAISCLTEQSIKNNGSYVEIPDFTRGKYKTRPLKDVTAL